MSRHTALVQAVLRDLEAQRPPESIEAAFDLLNPLSIGLRLHIPVISKGARLFRVRKMNAKPRQVTDVGAPDGAATIGRLNDFGCSVLYLADSPDTAFAEVQSTSGEYCLSEWRIQQPNVCLANGGFEYVALKKFFPNDLGPPGMPLGYVEDHEVCSLFVAIFTIPNSVDHRMYWWSIACGMTHGFAHTCERTATELIDGYTEWTGRFPWAGIAYPSMRKNKQSINLAFNDLGRTYVRLDHVQWVKREVNGSFSGIDIATSFDERGVLKWAGRPANYQLHPGQASRVTKIAPTVWSYENLDGTIPIFV
jgi:hypothetical protein